MQKITVALFLILEIFKTIMETIMKHKGLSRCSAKKLVGVYQKGVTMIEYALIAALISIIAITAIKLVGTNLNLIWTNISTNM